jgi:uncharacterized membrane protein
MSEVLPGPTGQAPKRSVLLIVSLCLNVALVVMIVAGILNAIYHQPPRGNPLGPEAFKEDAAPAERVKIDAIIAAHAGKIQELREADWAARRTAFKIFAAPNFDSGAFSNALAKAQDADDSLRREMSTVSAQAAAQLSPSERQEVAQKARRRFMWMRFFRGWRRGGMD